MAALIADCLKAGLAAAITVGRAIVAALRRAVAKTREDIFNEE